MVAQNPGLTRDEYLLLMQVWDSGNRAYGVKRIVQTPDGRIVYLTQAGMNKILGKHSVDFNGLSDDQVIALIMNTLANETPDDINGGTYTYDNVLINGRYETLVIVVSDQYDGMIITAYPETSRG